MIESILVISSVLVILLFASQVAGRLDRLHRRVSSARTTLWRRCNERYEAAEQLQNTVVVAAVLEAKVEGKKALFSAEHLYAESEITRLLQELQVDLKLELAQVRVQDARRMYNEAVRSTLYLRSWRISRWLRLSGRATSPKFVDFDDALLNLK